MTLRWEIAEKSKGDVGAYAHWWAEKERKYIPNGVIDPGRQVNIGLPVIDAPGGGPGGVLQETFYLREANVPLPGGAGNPNDVLEADLDETANHMPSVPDDTVLVGIVDTGISLSNSRFRMAGGQTRFISSWQQSAPFAGQFDLHCGQEIYEADIQAKLDAHGPAGQLGYVDETEFNRDLCLTEPTKAGGQRDLEMAAAHGTHVLDLAAGLDPLGEFADICERLRMIAVNLPAQYAHGSAGAFLPYFAINAVIRILHIADALWAKNNPGRSGGYPLAINFSYGMTAGPKDGNHIFEKSLAEILNARISAGKLSGYEPSPVRVIMPAGNDNLSRSAASIVLGKNGVTSKSAGHKAIESVTLPWCIKPADATANFLEVWLEALPKRLLPGVFRDFTVSISPPGKQKLTLKGLVKGQHQDLGDFARVYVDLIDVEDGKQRIGLLICIAPTTLDVAGAPLTPAGTWTVQVDHNGEPVDVAFYIQSDQSAVRGSKTGKRSYFDHPNYARFLENGALADTYSYLPNLGTVVDNDNWFLCGPVQRRGTHNALASLGMQSAADLVAIGGFDDSSGYPAPYSSSCDGNGTKETGREAISVSYPSENASSLFGLLAAGARDGSVTAFRGTSMATALATREAAFAFLTHSNGHKEIGTEKWFRERGRAREISVGTGGVTDHWGQANGWPRLRILKSGVGRIPSPGNDRLWHRLGR